MAVRTMRWVVVLAIVMALAGCERGDRYEVEYTNVEPRMEADAVVAIVRSLLEDSAGTPEAPDVPIDILGVHAMPFADMPAAVPGIEEVGGSVVPSGAVWVVEANGPFISMKGPPPGVSGPPFRTAAHGWFVVDDDSGEIIALSMDPD